MWLLVRVLVTCRMVQAPPRVSWCLCCVWVMVWVLCVVGDVGVGGVSRSFCVSELFGDQVKTLKITTTHS